MLGYIVRRSLVSVVVVLLVAIFTFALLYLTPGDPAYAIVGEQGTLEQVEEIRASLGLDRPFHIRFGKWFGALARGDLGESAFSRLKVTALIKDRVEPSVSITILATLISVVLAVPLGVLAAWKANTWIDRTVMIIAVVGFGVPSFVLGIALLWTFGIKLHFLPVAGYTPISEGFGSYMKHLILPSATAGLEFMGLIARMTRSSMLEVLHEDYIRTARAKGLREWAVLFRHALQNASLPVLTVIGLGIALLLSGLIIVEHIFAVPGMGRLAADALIHRDYPVIQGMILIVAVVYVGVNLGVDLMYAFLDPRIRY